MLQGRMEFPMRRLLVETKPTTAPQEQTALSGVFLQMTEMEVSQAAAENSLREGRGNVVEALITLCTFHETPFQSTLHETPSLLVTLSLSTLH